jgi:hypothetical protein
MLVSKMRYGGASDFTIAYAPEVTSAAGPATQAAAHNTRIINLVVYASSLGAHGK